MTQTRTDWMDAAACRDHDTTHWYDYHRTPRAALRVCATCDVQNQCLTFALRMENNAPAHLRFGVWGATTPTMRHKLMLSSRPLSV